MNRTTAIIALAAILLAAVLAWPMIRRDDDYLRYHNHTFSVAAVVDGNTLELAVRDGGRPTTRVRLWGVDSPSPGEPGPGPAGQPRRAGPDYFGQQAVQFTRSLAAGQTVRLELLHDRMRDKQRCLLAYVYLPDNAMLNERIIETGHGYADTRVEHDRLERFKVIERRAMRAKAGLWREVRPDQLPAWRGEPRIPPGEASDPHAG